MAVTDRLQGFNIGAAVKPACVVTTTGANLTLSGAQTIDGISVGSCERVLVQDQTDASENGIYLADSSTWIRTRDFDGPKDAIPGSIVYVDRGNTYPTSFWVFNSSSTATSIGIGTDDITVSRVDIALAGVSAFSDTLLALGTAAAWRSTSGLSLGSASTLDSTAIGLLSSTGLQWVGIQSWNKGGDLASANNMTLGSTANYFDVTGGTTINTIAAVRVGTKIGLHFDSTLVLTHSTALVLPTSANVVTVAGDEAQFIQYTTGADWRCVGYLTSDGRSLGGAGLTPASTTQMAAENTSTALAVTPGVQAYHSGHPKAVLRVTGTTSTSPTVTTTYSAIGTITCVRDSTGQWTLSWPTSLTSGVVSAFSQEANNYMGMNSAPAPTTSVTLQSRNDSAVLVNSANGFFVTIWGDI